MEIFALGSCLEQGKIILELWIYLGFLNSFFPATKYLCDKITPVLNYIARF